MVLFAELTVLNQAIAGSGGVRKPGKKGSSTAEKFMIIFQWRLVGAYAGGCVSVADVSGLTVCLLGNVSVLNFWPMGLYLGDELGIPWSLLSVETDFEKILGI